MIVEKENILKTREWRYSVKKFDSTKKVSENDLNLLLESIRLSASSYGLQPYHVYVISNEEVKSKLRPFSWNQSQIEDASHLLVFANEVDFGEDLVDDYLDNVSETRQIPSDGLEQYGSFMKQKLMPLPSEVKRTWTSNQVYIALGNALQAAAELEIDSCPMEGFEEDKYNEILGLSEKGLNASVVLAIGYRSNEDATQHLRKVRKTENELFTHI